MKITKKFNKLKVVEGNKFSNEQVSNKGYRNMISKNYKLNKQTHRKLVEQFFKNTNFSLGISKIKRIYHFTFCIVLCFFFSLTIFSQTNNPPIAANDTYSGTAARGQSAPGLLANDSDPDGDSIGIAWLASAPQNGTAYVNGNGSFTYTPNAGYTGDDSFAYTVCDIYNACNNATVTVIKPNSAPNGGTDTYSGVAARHQNAPGLLANDSDPDGDNVYVRYLRTPPQQGYLSLNGDGSFDYTPYNGYTGDDSFSYESCDSYNSTCTDTTVNLIKPNSAPIGGSDSFRVKGLITTSASESVLLNDSDPDGDSFSVAYLAFGALHGTVNINANGNGTFSYTPFFGYSGSDSFGYSVCDSLGACGQGVVFLTVFPTDGAENAGSSCPIVAQPINVTNGNMWLRQTDYVLSGSGTSNINISRFYNTLIQSNGLFGKGWSTQYDQSLQIYDDRMIRFNMADGRAVYFMRENTTDPFTPATSDFYGQIEKDTSNLYTLTMKDGQSQQFSSAGKLLWVKERDGDQTTLTYDTNGDLTGITDAFGRTLTVIINLGLVSQLSDSQGTIATYAYNTDGTLESVTYPDNSKYQFTYTTINGNQYLTDVKDALNNVLESHQYDSSGRATTSVKDSGVESYTFDYSHIADSVPYTLVTDALSRETKYYSDRSKDRNVVTKIEGNCSSCGGGSEVDEFEYDEKLNLAKKKDALNRETTYTYDSEGNPLTMTDVLGTETYTYNSFGQVLTRTDRMNGVWTNTYDSSGNLLTVTDPLSVTTTLTYNSHGQPLTVTDARNKTTTFSYNNQGLLAQSANALNQTTDYLYDARGRLTTVTNAANQTTQFEYDARNRPKKTINPDTTFTEYSYDLGGRRTQVKDELGRITSFAYDNANRLTAVTDALNHTSQIGYDLMSNVTSKTDALGNVTNYEYDAFDRLIKTIYPAETQNATRQFETVEYDAIGNITKRTDTAGRQTLYAYDNVNRLTSTTDADNKVTQFTYNARSQMTKVKDALNQEYDFTYDALGRTLSQTRAGSSASFQYDDTGNLSQRTDYNGTVTNYVYDDLNRLTQVQYPQSSENVSFIYDNLSRMQTAQNYAGTISFNYDARSRLISTTDVHGKIVGYGYDEASNRTQMSLDNQVQATYAYDNANRLTTLTDDASQNVSYTYDDADRLISKLLPNGIGTSYEYDGMSRLRRLKDEKQANILFDKQYGYDTANNISQITEPTKTQNYNYDLVDRLTQVADSLNQQNESYAYDGVGNRASSHLSTSYQYSPSNRLTSSQQASFVYDSNGNMTSKTDVLGTTQYIWDYENKLKQVNKPSGSSVSYQYDALGRRVERTVTNSASNPTWTKFSYDGEDVILDVNSDGSLTKYLNGLEIDDKIRQSVTNQSSTDISYFVQDHLGSTIGLTDTNGTLTSSSSYDSFGNAIGNLGSRYGFTGRELDSETGLYYYRNRWYSTELGRFISEDSIGLRGGINQFSYIGNNPLAATDAFGLFPDGPVNYLRNPFDSQRWILNGLSNTLSDLLMLDSVAQWSWTIGDYRCSTSDRVTAGAKLAGWTAFNAIGGYVIGKTLGLAGRALRPFANRISPRFAGAASRMKSANPCLLCFEANTEVQTEDGAKPIEKISTDDKVLSYNTETGELSYQAVLQKFTRFADDIYNLKIKGEEKAIVVTSEHPFFVKVHQARDNTLSENNAGDKGEWREVKNLKAGNEIKLASGKWAKILEVKFKGSGQVYNFSVANNHNYFVGGLKLLTHNKCPELPAGVIPESKILDLGERYLGRGYTEASPGRYVSRDGLRQFRFGSDEVKRTPYHAHFESYDFSYWLGGTLTENSRVILTP